MKLFFSLDAIYWSCHIIIKLFLIFNFYKIVYSKCTLDKHDIRCFGSTWKQDLLPIEYNSLEKLYISRCTESETHSETVDINFLRNVTRLSLFSMTNCALIRPPIVNYQINSIEMIDLSNNLIDTNAQFPVLGLDFFKQFPNLRVLNLTNNRLTHLPKSWFDCPSQLEMIILDGNHITGLNPSLASCFVNLKHLSLSRNLFVRLKMPTEPRKTFNSAYLKDAGGLKLFADQNVLIRQGGKKAGFKEENKSRGRHDFFSVFPKFRALETLDLSYNQINSIDQIPLSYLENLHSLNMSYNRLSRDVVSGIHEVGCDFGTAPFYINGKLGITDLDLSGNKALTRIHSCWTFGLQNLQTLRIANCSISLIYDLAFDKMKSLAMLDLSNNMLGMVPKEITVVSKSLIWLSLANNNLTQMSSFYLSSLENLRTLNLSRNQYQNLITFPVSETESQFHDSIGDFSAINRNLNSEEPIHLLGQMRNLLILDLSYNDLRKVSAISDLSPSFKSAGGLASVDLRGNPSISQFIGFNFVNIATGIREFLVDDHLRLLCDCNILGFIKWITQRHFEISGRCSSPTKWSQIPITDPQLITVILANNSCADLSSSSSMKATYRVKLFYNANVSVDYSQSENGPMDDSEKRSGNQKRQLDYQKWVMMGNNLTLRCEFLSTYPVQMPINIEWQRLKIKPLERKYFTDSSRDHQQSLNIFLKNDKPEPFDTMKYVEKVEHLSANYDPRIKIAELGPIDEDTVVDSWSHIERVKNAGPHHILSTYKYVGFLLLKPVLLSDIGRYRCVINGLPSISMYGQNQLVSKEEIIKIFTPPRFTSTPSKEIAIIEGDTVEITCRAIGTPLPLTSLSRIGSKEFPAAKGRRMRIYKDDSSFFITSVRQVDSGNYSCTSRNMAATISYNFTLKVQTPATILNKNQPRKTVKVGEPLLIGFRINGVPLPDIKWLKDDQVIMESDRITFSADRQMLVVQSAVVTDSGLYKISIMNAFGGNEASVSVTVLDSQSQSLIIKDKLLPSSNGKEHSWMPDYWLSGIIITVILSILITSILWIVIFFCFTKIIGSKKRRLLLISNSQSRSSFDKPPNTITTSFSNPQICVRPMFRPLRDCSIPLSLTTSTLVPHDSVPDTISDIDNLTNVSMKPTGEFYSPQLFRTCLSSYSSIVDSGGNGRFLSTSGLDRVSEPCDSGIDSSQVYSETLNSSDIQVAAFYHPQQQQQQQQQQEQQQKQQQQPQQQKQQQQQQQQQQHQQQQQQKQHKSKHRTNHHQKQRKRYVGSTSSDSIEAQKCVTKDLSDQKYDSDVEGMLQGPDQEEYHHKYIPQLI